MTDLRLGVDVGGTFTKAVAVDPTSARVVARAVAPTSHDGPDGVSAGVVAVIAELARAVGPARVGLVTHSTTQAVNAMLEGDAAPVGILGLGRAPDVRKARKRTSVPAAAHEFLDVTAGLDTEAVRQALLRLRAAGARTVCVAEAFAPDDSTNERAAAAVAAGLDLPVTTSAELTGLYGLELRTVTAALNASILPVALHTARVVADGVAAAGITAPVMMMRGDGGATSLAAFRDAPARSLYSGPAASVAGALRTQGSGAGDAVIVEVGGTSTNVAAIRGGRPALRHVRVAGRATAVRALDVQVVGVAGGSLLRVRRGRVHGVGPRSAHIAGLPYACFLAPDDLDGAVAETVAPRPGDPADHLVLRRRDGTRAALTVTCAANALGIVPPGDHAAAGTDAAAAAFAVAGAALGLPGAEVARQMLECCVEALADLVTDVVTGEKLTRPVVLAVGGGAGVLGRPVAQALGLDCVVPAGAEVISAIGDALSLVRAERERTVARPTTADSEALIAQVLEEATAAGATPGSVQVELRHDVERGALRAVAVGALTLASGAVPGRPERDPAQIAEIARRTLDGAAVRPVGRYWVGAQASSGRVLLLDRFGDTVLDVRGDVVWIDGTGSDERVAALRAVRDRHTRHAGPVTFAPTTWLVEGTTVRQLTEDDAAAAVRDAHAAAVVVGRE